MSSDYLHNIICRHHLAKGILEMYRVSTETLIRLSKLSLKIPSQFEDISNTKECAHLHKKFRNCQKCPHCPPSPPSLSSPFCGVVVYWLSLMYNFIQQSLKSGSVEVKIWLAAYQSFAVMRISDNVPDWK